MTTQQSLDQLCHMIQSDIESRRSSSNPNQSIAQAPQQKNSVLIWIAGIGASVAAALFVAATIGVVSMMSKASTANSLAEQKFEFVSIQLVELKGQITELEKKVEVGTQDKWTKENQKDYQNSIEEKIESLENHFKSTMAEQHRSIDIKIRELHEADVRQWEIINEK